jgi:hypothetical protein
MTPHRFSVQHEDPLNQLKKKVWFTIPALLTTLGGVTYSSLALAEEVDATQQICPNFRNGVSNSGNGRSRHPRLRVIGWSLVHKMDAFIV